MKRCGHSNLWLYFAGIVFTTIAAVAALVAVVMIALYEAGYILIPTPERHVPIVVFLLGSLLVGAVIALFVGRLIIRPVENISNAFDQLSRGNFSIRVPEDERVAQIRDMACKFNAMAHDLSNIETLRTDFVVNVSHEFKTPLSSIEGYATLLQNSALAPKKREYYIRKILDNSRKLSDLSSDILMLSKLENQQIVPGGGEFRLDEQIRKTILLLEDRWSARQIEFDMELPRQMYYGSEALLERVWSNIIDNAIKHSDVGGSIRITMEQRHSQVCVTIADDGCGMSQEVQKHIFEKFYQGDPSRREEGNGLGLALVRRIVELCNGQISVRSSPGCGAAFTVTLPLTQQII